MATTKLILECPRCHWMFEAKRPNSLHSTYSFEKPQEGRFHGDVIQENFICRNPKCRKPIAVYWFEPPEFFSKNK